MLDEDLRCVSKQRPFSAGFSLTLQLHTGGDSHPSQGVKVFSKLVLHRTFASRKESYTEHET